jgi:CTP:molybdopterin cytidylyltransferase MocA
MLTFSDPKVTMLIMTGSGEGSEVERMVAQARQAITLDTVDKALTVEAIDRVIVSTNSRPLVEALPDKPVYVELDAPGEAFHFGRQLLALVDKYEIERLFYVGGGSGPLLSAEEMGHIAENLLSAERLLIANNFYSTDFAAFTPASILKETDPPAFDNDLGWLLGETLGLPTRELPRTAATQLDVDTPMDLMTLQLHPAAGRHVRRYLESLDLDISHLEEAIQFFTDREAMVIVAGRVSAATWTYLESETACQVRLFAEERGMRASGRQARGEARSLLGFYLDKVGAERFFTTLGTLGQAAFIDSRVIFAHRGLWPPAADRFYSDLRQPEKITDPFVRHFTEAAMQAPIPIVLGGHSLVAGGLYALIEAAWARGEDLPRHIIPQSGL